VSSRKRGASKLRTGLLLAGVVASCEPVLRVGDLACPFSDGGRPGFDENGMFTGCNLAPSAGNGGTSAAGSGGTSAAPMAGGAGLGGASEDVAGGNGGADDQEGCSVGGGPEDMSDDAPLTAPWTTSFETGFCSYNYGGFCYSDAHSSYRIVTSPVRSGSFAAAFDMRPSSADGARQTRCVRQGVLPAEAYYGAWYYVPSDLTGAHTWNLFHFQGGPRGAFLRGLWDVTMTDDAGNGYVAFIFDTVRGRVYAQTAPKPIPRDRWFQLEFYLKRAADATGEVALYQDGEEVVRRTGIATDDTPYGEWYVGNYAAMLESLPATVSVYVDDVTVRLP